jgi:hypothetical protein
VRGESCTDGRSCARWGWVLVQLESRGSVSERVSWERLYVFVEIERTDILADGVPSRITSGERWSSGLSVGDPLGEDSFFLPFFLRFFSWLLGLFVEEC